MFETLFNTPKTIFVAGVVVLACLFASSLSAVTADYVHSSLGGGR